MMEEGRGRDKPKQLNTFEDLLELVGSDGRWNVLLYLTCSLAAFVSPMLMMSYQFLGATPDHWCLVPELQEANWTQHQVISFAIPHNSNTSDDHDQCTMYNYNYTEVVDMGYEAAIVNKSSLTILSPNPVKCLHRDFNHSQYQSTVVTEWDLVCERRALYSTTQSAVMLGKMLGTLIMGWLLDLVGRRAVARVSSLFYFLTAILVIASPGVTLYIIMKAITSAMDAGLYLSSFIILMETSATRHRAAMGTLFGIPWALGYILVPGIAYILKGNWRWLQLAYSLPTTLFIVYFVWLPESPRWLITQARFQEALKVLKWAAKVNRNTLPSDDVILDAMTYIEKQTLLERSEEEKEEEQKEGSCQKNEEEVEEMKERNCQKSEELNEEERKESNWCDSLAMKVVRHCFILLLNPQLRLRTLVIFFGFFSSTMVYFGVSLNATNLGTDPYLYVFLGGLLEVPSYLLLWPMMVFVGRRRSLALLFFTCAVCIFSVMAFMLIQLNELVVVVLSLAGKVAITAALQLIWAYTSELYPTKVRSLALGEANFLGKLGSLCSPYINDLLGEVVVWGPSALFGLVSLMAAALALILPETRHSDMQEALKH